MTKKYSDEVFSELHKIASDKGWLESDVENIVKSAKAAKAESQEDDAFSKVMKFAKALRAAGKISQAEIIEEKAMLYSIAKAEALADVLRMAHEGDVEVAKATNGLGNVETLESTQKKMQDVAKKNPTGKYAKEVLKDVNFFLKKAQGFNVDEIKEIYYTSIDSLVGLLSAGSPPKVRYTGRFAGMLDLGSWVTEGISLYLYYSVWQSSEFICRVTNDGIVSKGDKFDFVNQLSGGGLDKLNILVNAVADVEDLQDKINSIVGNINSRLDGIKSSAIASVNELRGLDLAKAGDVTRAKEISSKIINNKWALQLCVSFDEEAVSKIDKLLNTIASYSAQASSKLPEAEKPKSEPTASLEDVKKRAEHLVYQRVNMGPFPASHKDWAKEAFKLAETQEEFQNIINVISGWLKQMKLEANRKSFLEKLAAPPSAPPPAPSSAPGNPPAPTAPATPAAQAKPTAPRQRLVPNELVRKMQSLIAAIGVDFGKWAKKQNQEADFANIVTTLTNVSGSRAGTDTGTGDGLWGPRTAAALKLIENTFKAENLGLVIGPEYKKPQDQVSQSAEKNIQILERVRTAIQEASGEKPRQDDKQEDKNRPLDLLPPKDIIRIGLDNGTIPLYDRYLFSFTALYNFIMSSGIKPATSNAEGGFSIANWDLILQSLNIRADMYLQRAQTELDRKLADRYKRLIERLYARISPELAKAKSYPNKDRTILYADSLDYGLEAYDRAASGKYTLDEEGDKSKDNKGDTSEEGSAQRGGRPGQTPGEGTQTSTFRIGNFFNNAYGAKRATAPYKINIRLIENDLRLNETFSFNGSNYKLAGTVNIDNIETSLDTTPGYQRGKGLDIDFKIAKVQAFERLIQNIQTVGRSVINTYLANSPMREEAEYYHDLLAPIWKRKVETVLESLNNRRRTMQPTR